MTARVTPQPPSPLDKVLALRPTNVVSRFGQPSRLPLLNPRDLLAAADAAADGHRQALVCVPAYSRAQLGGLLRASRDEDAVIGIACPYPLAERDGPARFSDAVRELAEEVRHRKPFFLQAGPFRLRSGDPRAREGLSAAVYEYLEAGCTLVSLDASALGVEDAVAAYRELSSVAQERELSIEVAAPLDAVGALDAEALRRTLELLGKARLRPDFVRVPGRAYALEDAPRESWQLDLSVLAQAREIVRGAGAELSVEDEGAAPEQLAGAWLEAGVRKADVAGASARIALGGLLPEQQERLARAAREQGVPARELLAFVEGEGVASSAAQLKIEALSWSLAVDLLPCAGARGSAGKALSFLSLPGRY